MVNVAFAQVSVLMFLSVMLGYLAIRIRQPLILSFIIVGIIAGSSGLGWITDLNQIEVLASFGVTLLLFIVGLKMDLDLVRSFGKVAIVLGFGQIVFTTLLGYAFCLLLGMSGSVSIFVAIALTFSSTIIIIKLLSDSYEIDSLYGRMSVGILLVQDLVVVIAIIVLSSLHLDALSYSQLITEIATLSLKGVGFLAIVGLLMRYVIPGVLDNLARSRELLILFAFSWAIIFAVVSDALGFGKEVGGFLAGVSLASSHFRQSITSRLEPVRDLLLLFFFLNLGATFHFDAVGHYWLAALVLSAFILIGKPLIVLGLMTAMRFRVRTGFMSGITMGQLSEFSLIMAALGAQSGYIDEHVLALITLVAIITIGFSTYMMAYASKIYDVLKPLLGRFESQVDCREDKLSADEKPAYDIIIYGYGRHGEQLAKILQTFGFRILVIDFDPRKVKQSGQGNIHLRYGDAEDVGFIKSLPLTQVKWVVSTIPHRDASKTLTLALREMHYQGKIALTAHYEAEVHALEKLGVDMVIVPYREAAVAAADRLAAAMH